MNRADLFVWFWQIDFAKSINHKFLYSFFSNTSIFFQNIDIDYKFSRMSDYNWKYRKSFSEYLSSNASRIDAHVPNLSAPPIEQTTDARHAVKYFDWNWVSNKS